MNLLLSSIKCKDFKMNSFLLIKRQAIQNHKNIRSLCIIFNILSRSSKHFLRSAKSQHFDLSYYSKPYQTSTNFQMWCDAITPIRISHAQPLRLPYVVEPYMLHWSIFINVNTSNNSFFLLTIFLSHTSCEKMLLHYTTTLLHFFGL